MGRVRRRDRQEWQREACPAWCAVLHRSDDGAEDRVHRSAGVVVPVIARSVSFVDGRRTVLVESSEFDVGISRQDGAPETWFYIGSGPDRCIELTGESASRLLGSALVELRRMHGIRPGG